MSIKSRYEVSESAYNFAKSYFNNCREYRESCEKTNDTLEKSGHLLNETQNSIAFFIFCQICLEAYINTFAIDRLPKLVCERLDRIHLENKWAVFPELVLGKTFETDKEPYKLIKWLVEKRNFIVHYKGKFSELEMVKRLGAKTDRIFNQFKLEETEKAFQLAQNMIEGLHSLDNSKTPDWLV